MARDFLLLRLDCVVVILHWLIRMLILAGKDVNMMMVLVICQGPLNLIVLDQVVLMEELEAMVDWIELSVLDKMSCAGKLIQNRDMTEKKQLTKDQEAQVEMISRKMVEPVEESFGLTLLEQQL